MNNYSVLILALLVAGIAQAQITFSISGRLFPQVLVQYSLLVKKELVIESSATNQLKKISVRTLVGAVTKKGGSCQDGRVGVA